MFRVRMLVLLVLAHASIPGAAVAAPGSATLIAPSGDVTGSTIAFTWQSVPGATWYLLWIGAGSPPAFVLQQWYTAAQVGCAGGGSCSITLTPPIVAGSHVWYIQAWDGEFGPWSAAKGFVLKDTLPSWSRKLPDARRFTLVLDDEGVLDNETGLVWQRTPGPLVSSWTQAYMRCVMVTAGGRMGWRLPSIGELTSLMDLGQTPRLPAGHPFQLGVDPAFWAHTSIVNPSEPAVPHAMVTFFQNSVTGAVPETTATFRTWCVRGPTGAPR